PVCTAEPSPVTATGAGAGLGTPREQQLACRQWLLWAAGGPGTRLSGRPCPARSPGGETWACSHHYEQRENSVLLQDESKMKAKEQYQSDVWLETEHLTKGEELRSQRGRG
ncbi:unnamed protein product, partial [Gulo gulo]